MGQNEHATLYIGVAVKSLAAKEASPLGSGLEEGRERLLRRGEERGAYCREEK